MENEELKLRGLLAEALRRLVPSPGGPAATIEDLAARIKAALATQPAEQASAGSGQPSVPIAPTDAMKEAFADELTGACGSFFDWESGGDAAYAAMLAAAPLAPSDTQGAEGLVPCAYRIGPIGFGAVKIEECGQIEGPPLWAVRQNGNCLNRVGEWEYEPMPSSRDDEFLARCRFATAQEAYSTMTVPKLAEAGKGE